MKRYMFCERKISIARAFFLGKWPKVLTKSHFVVKLLWCSRFIHIWLMNRTYAYQQNEGYFFV